MQKLKKGDKVKVLIGKDSGKEGTIDRVSSSDNRVYVSGVNVYKRHIRRNNQANMEGGIIDLIKPMNISNVSLICPSCKQVTRIGFEIEKSEKYRICRKCKKRI